MPIRCKRILFPILALVLCVLPVQGKDETMKPLSLSTDLRSAVDQRIEKSLGKWVDFYKICHADPELSLHEEKSAERMARRFEELGIKTTARVGGYGVVGVLANGEGPTVLIRGDMDALPITETTGLPYASKVTSVQPDGTTVGVMHACGHDMHQTVLAATAQVLSELKSQWKGTVVFVAQPAEEIGQGARAMVNDGLFERFPKPNYCIALHVSHELEAGSVGYTSGWACANVDSVDITIFGRGGHGAHPDETVDPIVAASQLVLALQTIVSRRVHPDDTAVITVGSIHAGTKHNIIPGEAKLQLTVRSFTDEVRKLLLDSIRQITTDICKAAGCPKPPEIQILDKDYTPALYNNPQLTSAATVLFSDLFGKDHVFERRPTTGGEDFGLYPRKLGVPGIMFWLGVWDSKRFAESKQTGGAPLPPVHSPQFRTDPEPTIRTGVRSMTDLALGLLGERQS